MGFLAAVLLGMAKFCELVIRAIAEVVDAMRGPQR